MIEDRGETLKCRKIDISKKRNRRCKAETYQLNHDILEIKGRLLETNSSFKGNNLTTKPQHLRIKS